ncbi:glucosamine-6-phosphate deaminase [Candidatus Woesearchaeota archaeon B3_Woes]|nr:MAG: glucosamine-6-phosphate deaminase [Candidatus Woesearchaeota archaeon B3_Woes]
MKLEIYNTKKEASYVAAKKAVEILNSAIKSKGHANIVAATGTSQFEFLKNVIKDKSIDWSKVTLFHLDEYIGLPEKHKASFRRYLRKRLINKIHLGEVHLIKSTSKDPKEEIKLLNKEISKKEIDIAFLGVGENGHLAFNDPPADFKTAKPFIIVKLDEVNRKQQLKEGWFSKLSDVPKQAISMSIKQIMKSENIICLVFGKRKSEIVKECFTKRISPMCPSSILKNHKKAFVYLDKKSALLL